VQAELDANAARRHAVIRRGLPRPPQATVAPEDSHVARELQIMLAFDAAVYPVDPDESKGKKKKRKNKKKAKNLPRNYTEFTVLLVSLRNSKHPCAPSRTRRWRVCALRSRQKWGRPRPMLVLVLNATALSFHFTLCLSPGDVGASWVAADSDITFLPSRKAYGHISDCSKADKLKAVQQEFELLRQHLHLREAQGDKEAQKLAVMQGGYAKLSAQHAGLTRELHMAHGDAVQNLSCFQMLSTMEYSVPLCRKAGNSSL
jgi:hypothetical protein